MLLKNLLFICSFEESLKVEEGQKHQEGKRKKRS